MNNPFKIAIFYGSFPLNDAARSHRLSIDKRNSVANTKELIDLINGDSLIEAKQHLMKVLDIVEAAELPGGGRDIECDNCDAEQYSIDERMFLEIDEPAWSNCAGCELK